MDYVQNYQREWKEHKNRTNTGRIWKQILRSSAQRRKIRVGSPVKRRKENMRL